MKIKSALATAISGSLGGITGSHNRGGIYLRARTIPTNPASAQQVAMRNIMAQLTPAWGQQLSFSQQNAWNTYGDNVPVVDALGESRNLTGQQWFIAANAPRLQAGLARVDNGPTIYDRGDAVIGNNPISDASEAAGTYDITFTGSDDWVSEDGAALLVYSARPVGPGVRFFKGPYRYADAVLGDSSTPPSSPATITSPFAIVEGAFTHVQLRVSRADGRLSSPFRGVALGEA